MKLTISSDKIDHFENVTGTCIADALFAIITIHRTRIPACRGTRIGVRYLDEEGIKKLIAQVPELATATVATR